MWHQDPTKHFIPPFDQDQDQNQNNSKPEAFNPKHDMLTELKTKNMKPQAENLKLEN